MKIGIIGGTGGMGEGFALRWSFNHDILLGSRDRHKAQTIAKNYVDIIKNSKFSDSIKGNITGDDNKSIASESEVLILTIPYENIHNTCREISDVITDECTIVSPIVPMGRNSDGFFYIPLEKGKKSAGTLVAENLPNCKKIVSAFHTISEVKLKNLETSINSDTFVCTSNKEALSIVSELIKDIDGLRQIYLGPLSLSYQAEIMTPMILNASKQNKLKNPGVKIV